MSPNKDSESPVNQSNQQLIEQLNLELKNKSDELNKLREQFVLTEKLAFIGQLSAGILHEIKNPLNFVNNFSKLSLELVEELNDTINKTEEKSGKNLKDELLDLSGDLEGNLKKILENGERAQRVIFSMLAQARDNKNAEFILTDINQMVDEFAKLAYQGIRGNDSSFNVTIKTNYDVNVGKISVVPQDMSRVIINLVNNGCYALNEKKKKLGDAFSPVITLSTRKNDKFIEISIKDNGTGIPQSVIDKIFHPFYTTKPVGQGTGLGLSLCFDIITKTHKGTIDVNTKEGEYTEFVISIPANE